MFSKVLVPLDGSPMAEETLCLVEDLVKTHKGQLMLLRVANFHAFPGADNKTLERQAVERAEEYLARIEADLKAKGVNVSTHVRVGDPATEILSQAEKYASVVVMTTHGRGGLTRWAMGSVADRVIRRSKKPVLIIRPKEACQV